MGMIERNKTLQERESTHGNFKNNAAISQFLKAYFRKTQDGYADAIANAAQWEALDMICLKLSRVLSGQADFKDHWRDIAGYAHLGMESCDERKLIERRIRYLDLRIGATPGWDNELEVLKGERQVLLNRLKVMGE
jgi:hypothetical protein